MGKTKLEVTIDLEDYTAGLFGKICANSFSGFGEGWFNLIDIQSFISKAREMINSLEGNANIFSAQHKADGSEYLERFGLRCYPIGKSGVIGVHVTLTDYPYTDCRPEEIFKVSGEIKTEVQLVENFLNELSTLITGLTDKAVLIGRE